MQHTRWMYLEVHAQEDVLIVMQREDARTDVRDCGDRDFHFARGCSPRKGALECGVDLLLTIAECHTATLYGVAVPLNDK